MAWATSFDTPTLQYTLVSTVLWESCVLLVNVEVIAFHVASGQPQLAPVATYAQPTVTHDGIPSQSLAYYQPPVPLGSPQKCAIPECPRPCYMEEGGKIHECCGRTHAEEYRRRCSQQQCQLYRNYTGRKIITLCILVIYACKVWSLVIDMAISYYQWHRWELL